MKRGEIYLVKHPSGRDPKRQRAFVVVSRHVVIESRYATVICAPVYSARAGIATQVNVGIEDGFKHDSAVHCDELVSLPKSVLTDYVGSLSGPRVEELNAALKVALAVED